MINSRQLSVVSRYKGGFCGRPLQILTPDFWLLTPES